MRILVVNFQDAQHPSAGGAEVHLHEMFGRLASRGHDVTLVSAAWPGAASRVRIDGIDIHRVGTRGTFAVAAWRKVRELMRGHWDVVIEDLNKAPMMVHRWSTVPTALLVHHLFGKSAFSAAAWPVAAGVVTAERLIGRAYRGVPVVAVSESTAADLERVGVAPTSIRVITNGAHIPDVPFTPLPRSQDVPRLLVLGRLQPYKRVDVVLRATKLLAERGTPVIVDVVGDGVARQELTELARALGVASQVVFHGRVSEEKKAELLAGATLHVTASAKEGWGLSVIEAGIHGIPTVASFVPGLRDSVIEGRTGRFTRPDDPRDLANVLQHLLEAPFSTHLLGNGARRFAELHDWERVADHMEHFLGDVASGRFVSLPRTQTRQRDPFLNTTLPRNGASRAPFGASRFDIELQVDGRPIRCTAIIASRDPAGRLPIVTIAGIPRDLLVRLRAPGDAIQSVHKSVVEWQLWGWPDPPHAWIAERLSSGLGGSNAVSSNLHQRHTWTALRWRGKARSNS